MSATTHPSSNDGASGVNRASNAGTNAEEWLPPFVRLRLWLQTLPFMSPIALVALSLLMLSSMHAAAIYLFSQGFLLTRHALADANDCQPFKVNGQLDPSCTMPATHQKLVLLVVDALRADYVFPVDEMSKSASRFYSNHVPLPAHLTDHDPTRSFVAHFIADAPTTTLQRIKGLTTGSLPTFVDAGSNFGAESILEDNWLRQASRAGKRLAMVGDDTWLKVFPTVHGTADRASVVWAANMTRGYDSFNVEDLDTVDDGVRSGLLTMLDSPSEWDILIAHNLGLDHAGHRHGAEHAETTRKLRENQLLLERVVEKLGDDTLLVVLGDHGMTNRGDHGGDSRDEVDAALWIYSKGPQLVDPDWIKTPPFGSDHPAAALFNSSRDASELADRMLIDWPERGLPTEARSVAQVDLVPTLSLLLGLPIPFGNLGQPIPELFYRQSSLPAAPEPEERKAKRSIFGRTEAVRGTESLSPLSTLLHAHLLQSSQLSQFLSAYTSEPTGSDLARHMPELHFHLELAKSSYRGAHAPGHSRAQMEKLALDKFWTFGRKTRQRARSVWAKFDSSLIWAGLGLWIGSVLVGCRLAVAARTGEISARELIGRGLEAGLAATWATTALWLMDLLSFVFRRYNVTHGLILLIIGSMELGVLSAPSGGLSTMQALGLPSRKGFFHMIGSLAHLWPVIAHAALFASNSFTVFEDVYVLFALSTLLLATLVKAFAAPEARLRKRLIGFASVALVCVRLISLSTSCREEQTPHCHVTFYQKSGSPAALGFVALAYVAAWLTPTVLRSSLALSASDVAVAPPYLGILLRGLLLSATSYWAVDWSIAGLNLDQNGIHVATTLKTTLARVSLAGGVLLATIVWHYTPLCLRVQRESLRDEQGQVVKTQVTLTGFANALGSSYLLFYAAVFTIVFVVSPPVGQVVLALQTVVVLCLLELFDSERDVQHLYDMLSSEESLNVLLDSVNDKSTSATTSANTAVGDDTTPLATPTLSVHSGPTVKQLVVLALLSHLSFFATGHQATFPSIQWSTAFVGLESVTYPISPLLVILNTIGPSHLLVTLSVPLFVLWNLSPTLKDQPPLYVARDLTKSLTAYMTIQTVVGLSSAFWSSYFRRHLFVWKVFAPRFMLSGLQVLSMDLVVVVLCVGWGVRGVLEKARTTLGTKVAE
ncbi:mannose-ethanolamine phosphotransferase gpi13 [Microbotryomycetes sp. JL201]|nr:mannose-ethanolamine phosphotransferase gpi13 [Microbotryomycetes sp. JL201]